MPEMPEVETVRRVLEPQIRGLTMEHVIANRPEVIAYPDGGEFCKRLAGQIVSGMGRRGKFLLILMDSGDRLVIHLRMTGCLLLTPMGWPEEKHTHLVFQMDNGKELRFSDPRRFGRVWLLREGETDLYSGIEKLGLEPLAPDFSAEYLIACFGKRKKTVKECLLDQSGIAGIGNIYSDEILFAAGIHPARRANCLIREEWERLAAVIPQQLSYFVEKNETTPEEYLKTRGQEYRNTPFLRVYGREGRSCLICGSALCRVTLGGRSSTYCPNCQV